MSGRARIAVAVGAGLAVVGGVAALVVARGRGGASADVAPPRGEGTANVTLPVRVTSRADFVAQLRKAMVVELPEIGRNTRQLIVAHGAFESGWGDGPAFRKGWNFANITAGRSWQGDKWEQPNADDEYASDGTKKRIAQVWRVYGSLNEALRDYWSFLGGARYLPARQVLANSSGLDSDAFAAALRAGGYFTAPLAKYQDGLRATLATVAQNWI